MATPLKKPSDLTKNKYKTAQVLGLNEHVEEDITLLIEGTVINCFISYCCYEVEIGKTYDVELTINLSDDYEIERNGLLAEKIDTGYAYLLYSELHNDKSLTFTSLYDEGIHYDHPRM